MRISGLQKLTLLDFPGHTAAIVFTRGCNFRCSYCYNYGLVDGSVDISQDLSTDDVLDFLNERKQLLTGVVITGGEPTIQKDLIDFLKQIREIGLDIKLDTNGSFPDVIESIIEQKLVDYIAMDIKTMPDDYENITCVKTNAENIKKSIDLIKKGGVPHEFRTTIIKNYHDIKKIMNICEFVGGNDKLYLQNFEMNESVVNKKWQSFQKDELVLIKNLLKDIYSNVEIRNV